MGRRNAEGYYDPTAYAGINLAEPKKENQTVRLVYRNGRMELYIHEFFPCTAAVARRVFPLIRRFAGEEDKAKLRKYLLAKVQEHSGRMQDFFVQAGKYLGNRKTGIFTGQRRGKNRCCTIRRRKT